MKRIDVLKKALEPILNNDGGYSSFICPSLVNAVIYCIDINLYSDNIKKVYTKVYENLQDIFPAFDRHIAITRFNGTTPRSGEVWFNNNNDRINFANYLLDVYKDDKIEIEDILKELNII